MGTAGTGKSTATKTLLQELRRKLSGHRLEVNFFKVAAPTGTAAFNVRFNATTIHRLIQWFSPRFWSELTDPIKINRLQTHLEQTELIVIDEISMVGRRMMGRIDSRLEQAKPSAQLSTATSLGNTSLVAVGDPGQCQAMGDEQLYDTTPHAKTTDMTANSMLSNRGLNIYSEFDKYIILSQVHRVNIIKDPTTQEDIDYNERANHFLQVLHRIRDLNLTEEDYYWLCKRKKSSLTLQERSRFTDAPVLMDFRRVTATNPENNCTHYNRMCLRKLSAEKKTTGCTNTSRTPGCMSRRRLEFRRRNFQSTSCTLRSS